MKHFATLSSLRDGTCYFLTPQVWKQAHQACQAKYTPPCWDLKTLVSVLLTTAWCCGDSQEERFATARAAYVADHQHSRRPGTTLAGFLKALAKLSMKALRALAEGVRARLDQEFVESLRIGGYLPVACDGSRLECPRAASLQQRLGQACKPDSAPMAYVTAMVLLPLGLPWAWRWGKGTANEHEHLRKMLPTLPERSLLVGDAFYVGYELLTTILQAQASFLVRLSSRIHLYTLTRVPLKRFRQGLVYYWPKHTREQGKGPLLLRLLRVRGKKADVWLLTNVLDRNRISHKAVSQIYRWRWRNEGLFRVYKRMLGKVKLQSRTIPLVHREAESSMLALQLLIARATQPMRHGRQIWLHPEEKLSTDSPRRVLLCLRGAIAGALRHLGPRQFLAYQRMLQQVRSQPRQRTSSRIRQIWPRKKPYAPPGPPKMRVMSPDLKASMARLLKAA